MTATLTPDTITNNSDNPMPIPVVTDNPNTNKNPFEHSIMILIEFKKMGQSKSLAQSQIQVDAKPEYIRAYKQLLQCNELSAITNLDNKIKAYVKARSIPSVILRESAFQVPLKLVAEVQEQLDKFKEQRIELVGKFRDVYKDVMEEDRNRLLGVWNEEDYISVTELEDEKLFVKAFERLFKFQWAYVEVNTPGKLQQISPAIYQKEIERVQGEVQEMVKQTQVVLQEELLSMVDHMIEKLSTDEDTGQMKKIRGNKIDKIKEALQLFADRNISGDAQINDAVSRLNKILDGVSVSDVKQNVIIRAKVQEGFIKIKTELDEMIVDRPTRKFRMDEDDE